MTLLRVLRTVWLIIGVLVIPACASLPPERVALREATPTGAGTGAAAPTLVYPGDLRVVTPAPSIDFERAAFSGHWLGWWNEQPAAPQALVVEQVEPTEAIVVVAMVGQSGPVWGRFRAQWVAGALRVVAPDGLVAQYYARADGTLLATMEGQVQILTSRMTRKP